MRGWLKPRSFRYGAWENSVWMVVSGVLSIDARYAVESWVVAFSPSISNLWFGVAAPLVLLLVGGLVLNRSRRSKREGRWLAAAMATGLVYVMVAIPAVLIPNTFFNREAPRRWWSCAALAASALLTGLLVATSVASPLERTGPTNKSGRAASALTLFAVGCPVCNKLVLLALGTTGAMKFFQPVQPVLAILSMGLHGWALLLRISQENACKVFVYQPTSDGGTRLIALGPPTAAPTRPTPPARVHRACRGERSPCAR